MSLFRLPDCPAVHYTELNGWPEGEQREVYACCSCGESITAGEVYVEFMDKHYHLDCAREEALGLLIEECGAVSGIAGVSALC